MGTEGVRGASGERGGALDHDGNTLYRCILFFFFLRIGEMTQYCKE